MIKILIITFVLSTYYASVIMYQPALYSILRQYQYLRQMSIARRIEVQNMMNQNVQVTFEPLIVGLARRLINFSSGIIDQLLSMYPGDLGLTDYLDIEKYLPIANMFLKIIGFAIPGLSEVKQLGMAIELLKISWKAIQLYRNNESMIGIIPEVSSSILGRRGEEDMLNITPIPGKVLIVEDMDVETFLQLLGTAELPKLSNEDENEIKTEVMEILHTFLTDSEEADEEKKLFMVDNVFVPAVKFIALYEIWPMEFQQLDLVNPV